MKQTNALKKLGTLFLFWGIFVSAIFAQTPPDGLAGSDLRDWLKANYCDGKHTTLGYTAARVKMYNYIDNHNNTITCVYSGFEQSWTYGGTGSNPDPINCEHTVPQSFFNEAEPMKSDLHHLFPTYSNWNSTRSNYPFAEIDDNTTAKWMYLTTSLTTIPESNIDLYSEYANSTFEPREDHKGDVARAIFYFYTMYPTQAGAISAVADINTLYNWHLADPVSQDEINRNLSIETYQGDLNPYITMPSLVALAWGFTPTNPTVPSAPAIQLTTSTSALSLSWTDVSNETGYTVFRAVNGGNYATLVTLNANAVNYTDNAVSAGNTYSYYLIAFNTEGNSAASNAVSGQLNSSGGSEYAAEVILSEYVEGSSYNKALELANFTGATVDLSNYSIKKQTNGAGSWESELVLSGTLAHGNVYVIANASASATLLALADLSTSSAAMSFNGNDPVGLFKNGNLIDVIGTFNSTATFGADKTLVRKADVTSPTTMYTEGDWSSYASDTYTYLGTHTMNLDSGTPVDTEAPSVPANLAASNITRTSVDLSWSASTDNNGVSNYLVFKNGVLEQTVATTGVSISGLSAGTTYSFAVKASDEAGNISEASSALSVTTAAEAISYCNSQGSNATYEWIAQVQIGSFTKTSGASGYTDYTATQVSLESGQSYALTLTPGFSASSYNEYWKIWIDYNADGDFASDELAFDSGSLSNAAISGNITIPVDALGTTRMRVSMKYNAAQTACETFSYGEVEDYTVVISEGVPDTQAPTVPTGLMASSVLQTSVTLRWNASSDNLAVAGYQIYQNGTQVFSTSGTSAVISGLNAATTYSFYVKAYDASGNVSAASAAFSATTSEPTMTYCAAKGTNASYEWIDLVQLGSMTNSTGNNGGYADFTTKTANVAIGSNTIYYSAGFSSSSYVEYWHMWMDLDHNGSFDDTERLVYGSSTSSATLSATFTIPATAQLGNTRMRVTMKYSGTATPCETFTYGEVEDYTVNISASQNIAADNNNLQSEPMSTDWLDDIKVYPNPASDALQLEFIAQRKALITITDITGRMVYADEINTTTETLQISSFEHGVYLLTINVEGKSVIKRFIKQ